MLDNKFFETSTHVRRACRSETSLLRRLRAAGRQRSAGLRTEERWKAFHPRSRSSRKFCEIFSAGLKNNPGRQSVLENLFRADRPPVRRLPRQWPIPSRYTRSLQLHAANRLDPSPRNHRRLALAVPVRSAGSVTEIRELLAGGEGDPCRGRSAEIFEELDVVSTPNYTWFHILVAAS
jgi:hypothetical protein